MCPANPPRHWRQGCGGSAAEAPELTPRLAAARRAAERRQRELSRAYAAVGTGGVNSRTGRQGTAPQKAVQGKSQLELLTPQIGTRVPTSAAANRDDMRAGPEGPLGR